AVRTRLARTGEGAGVPVVCVGNVVAGGAGKTPLALAITARMQGEGRAVHFLTRGYGGRVAGPHRVAAARDEAESVGDEALLLARIAPTWVARDRIAGARAAVAAGAGLIVMDDGFQNPALAKDVAILAIDGGYGFGNGRVMPAGPLREPVADALRRADAAVVIGADAVGIARRLGDALPLFAARLEPTDAGMAIAGGRVVAFAGIGRPEKFFATLRAMGCTLVATRAFPDHARYDPDTIMDLVDRAAAANALPVTTEKDFVRLPPEARAMVRALPVRLVLAEPERFAALLTQKLARHG
ncbi:MAG: tetraacyldisaccharide 4'-kinase, partial [Alphaproteobacteria bacterium]|nr:tetraacyldisaccharide 4'-kinase [Alphaproteobacteria bacterium]